jgi:hypothetical protein
MSETTDFTATIMTSETANASSPLPITSTPGPSGE